MREVEGKLSWLENRLYKRTRNLDPSWLPRTAGVFFGLSVLILVLTGVKRVDLLPPAAGAGLCFGFSLLCFFESRWHRIVRVLEEERGRGTD